jgi:hypothetical protein
MWWGSESLRARSAEKSSQHPPPQIPHLLTVKTIKTTASHHLDTFPGLMGAQEWQISCIFPEKPGCFFPIRNPLYFSAIFSF